VSRLVLPTHNDNTESTPLLSTGVTPSTAHTNSILLLSRPVLVTYCVDWSACEAEGSSDSLELIVCVDGFVVPVDASPPTQHDTHSDSPDSHTICSTGVTQYCMHSVTPSLFYSQQTQYYSQHSNSTDSRPPCSTGITPSTVDLPCRVERE
jgi:hypothetical protein